MDPPPPRSERRRRREYLLALEEERRKIQVFQRELPLCLELVTQSTSRASLSRSGRRLARCLELGRLLPSHAFARSV